MVILKHIFIMYILRVMLALKIFLEQEKINYKIVL